MDDHTPTPPSPEPSAGVQAKKRRWPRRVGIGLVVTGVVVGGAVWYLGRETTLQMIAERVSRSTGGKLTMTGVRGSLYGAMHIDRIVWHTNEQLAVATDIDLQWSPRQLLSRGIEINKLYAADVRLETLKQSDEPTTMPVSLAAPFRITLDDARLAKLTFVNQGAGTELTNIRMRLHGDKTQWQLRDAVASTPWGQLAADGSIAAARPFKLGATASLSGTQVGAGATPAQLKLRAGGDLNLTTLDITGQAGRAGGEARMGISPFAAIPLRTMTLNAHNIDPGFFNPSLPAADLSLSIAAKLDDKRAISGSINLVNDGPAGTIDRQRLPLRAFRGQLGGDLTAMRLSDVLLDFGAAGRFTGSGSVQRGADEEGLGTAKFALHTDRFDLSQIYGSMKPTRIAGDIAVANVGQVQTLDIDLAERGLRLAARARLENNVVDLPEARLSAGSGSIALSGRASLLEDKAFKVTANASRFNPADLGDYPEANINAVVNAAGVLAPAWRVTTDFALRPSRLFDQPLSGKGKLSADAKHVTGVDAAVSLGQNTVNLNGSFGAPGERMNWRVDGRQLATLRSDLYGAIKASGVVTGTMANPRTSFVADANGLGWVAAQRKADTSNLHVSGEAWLAGKEGARFVEAKGSGKMARFNPAAFGSPLPGSINGSFDASGRSGADWRGALNLNLQDSTLSKSPLWGHARLAADARHVSGADVDLHVGANVLAAKGSFGAAGDRLDWRIDAPQLAAIGPDFSGALRGAGTVSGTMDTPSLNASLEGQNLRLLTHNLRSLRATANLGSGRGGADPLVSDIQVLDYASGDTRVAAASLQTNGTRAAHTLKAAARGPDFDALTEVRGGWSGNTWAGTLAALQNKGRFAMTLAQPVPLRIGVAPGAGVAGLARPQSLAFNGAVIRLPAGTVRIDTLTKTGSRWNSSGAAAGVPLNYLAQFSEALRENVRGNLLLGASWAMDLRTAAATGGAPALAGNVRVFREGGDAIVGGVAPLPLGLRTFEARADVQGSALRTQLTIEGTRTGTVRADGTVQMIGGLVHSDSPLRMTANADMPSIAWIAPFAGQRDLDLDGSVKLALTAGGTIGTPSLNGSVNGDAMAVRWPEQGVRLRNGQLRAQLAGDRLVLQRLYLEGPTGSATADGAVRFGGAGAPAMQLNLVANKLEVLSRPDRTVVVSGNAELVRDANRFTLDGNFTADRALIEFAPAGRPTISNDVIVLGRGKPVPPASKEAEVPLTVNLVANLGDDFHMRGLGLDAMLEGSVRVRMIGSRAPRVNGTIRVASGRYAAYGQKLDIERGVITFSGAMDNPALDVLAVRKLPEEEQLSETNVEAGVQVRGTAQSPQARLVSTPNVPDSEKLAWLVLGHGMEGTSGNEKDVLSAAAGALLGGKGGTGGFQSKMANALGVDELGIGQGSNGDAEGLANTVVTIGKRISSRAYLSFEQGATTASSLVRLRYKLTPKVSMQFQTGTNTALDVLYSWAFD